MPPVIKYVYLAAAGLALIALFTGLYDVAVGREGARLSSDVILPLAILGIVYVLYRRRRRVTEGHSE